MPPDAPDEITEPVDDGTITTTGTITEEPPPPRQRRQREPKTFSEEEVEAIRQQEQEKYNVRLTKAAEAEARLAELERLDSERQKSEEKARREQEKAAKKKEEDEMELRDLINRQREEFDAKLVEERQEREKAYAIVEQERKYASLQNYLAQRMAVESEMIMPELRDMVGGNSEEDIDSSIEMAKQKTESIMGQFQSRGAQERAAQRTAGVTQPPVGPMESVEGGTRTWTPDDIKGLNMEDYATYRESLLRAASQQRRQ